MKKAIILLCLLFLNSCSTAQTKLSKKDDNIRSLIIDCYKNLEKSNLSISDKVLRKASRNNEKIESLINPGQFSWIRNFGIKTKEDVIQFDKLFSEEEFASMKKQILDNKIKKWSELIDKKLFQSKENNIKNKYLSISIPVFNKDKNIAVIYFEFPNSGELRIYKKEENKTWKYIANGLVWRAD